MSWRGPIVDLDTNDYSPTPRKINENQYNLKPTSGWRLRQFIEEILLAEDENDMWGSLGYGHYDGDGESYSIRFCVRKYAKKV